MGFPGASRRVLARAGAWTALAVVLALAASTSSCGGGEGYKAKDMVLVEFLFVDRALNPTQPTGTQNLPRNAQILMVFSEAVNPGTVDTQTIQIRYGPQFQSVPPGSYSVDGNTVRFDPTVTAQGEPNPFGFQPVTQYSVDLPNFQEQPFVVQNRDLDPLLTTFFTSFKTSDGFLRELVPPQVLRVFFVPDPDDLTGQVPGNGVMAFEFSEAMDPTRFYVPCQDDPNSPACIEVRYDADAQINRDNSKAVQLPPPAPPGTWLGRLIPGSFTRNAAATVYFFRPAYSFGEKKYVFNATVRQCLTDLSGNLLINPRSFGDYVCDGKGRPAGGVLGEDFLVLTDADLTVTDADWGTTEEGVLKGQPVTSRNAYLLGYMFTNGGTDRWGQYGAIADPLIGAALNQYVANISPPTSDGRRVMWAFSDAEIGADGTITAAAWGPDSNATFAANYPNIILRCGFQKANTLALSPSFSGNYEGQPTVVYQGSYQVTQAANVGNTPGHPAFTHASITPYPVNNFGPPCGTQQNPITNQLQPLFDYTGFFSWPQFTNVFEWNEGDGGVENDRVLVFDASVQEGDTWQQTRGWFAVTFPCSGILIPGFPNRRMYTTYEDDTPNPATNFGAGILNPEPSVTDCAFNITKVVSVAQTLFYTDGAQLANSTQQTFGSNSNYATPLLDPPLQAGGAQIVIEYQACNVVEANRRTINQAAPYLPDFTTNVNDCDGYNCIRWRMRLISNLNSGVVARLNCIQLPVLDDFN